MDINWDFFAMSDNDLKTFSPKCVALLFERLYNIIELLCYTIERHQTEGFMTAEKTSERRFSQSVGF